MDRYALRCNGSIKGEIPIGMCLDSTFPFTSDINRTHLMWRLVEPTRQQDDFGPTEWISVSWSMMNLLKKESCILLDGSNGTRIVSHIPLPDTQLGKYSIRRC